MRSAFQIALNCHKKFDIHINESTKIQLSQKQGSSLSPFAFRSNARNTVRDIVGAYWELWFAYHDQDEVRSGRDKALTTWRMVKTLEQNGYESQSANVAQCRSHFFLCRARAETALTSLSRVEHRLRYLLGLSSSDGRLIRPIDNPRDKELYFDWTTIVKEALSNRTDLFKQKQKIKKLKADLQRVSQEAKRVYLVQRRHHQLLLVRETALQMEMEMECLHQLAEAIRDLELSNRLLKSKYNRSVATDDEVEAVMSVFKSGRVTIDLVLDSQRRAVDNGREYDRALVDYVRAISRVHLRKGTLLAHHGISILENK